MGLTGDPVNLLAEKRASTTIVFRMRLPGSVYVSARRVAYRELAMLHVVVNRAYNCAVNSERSRFRGQETQGNGFLAPSFDAVDTVELYR